MSLISGNWRLANVTPLQKPPINRDLAAVYSWLARQQGAFFAGLVRFSRLVIDIGEACGFVRDGSSSCRGVGRPGRGNGDEWAGK